MNAPCDGCVHAKMCAGAALACNAYIRFIDGRDWRMTLRIPTAKATRVVAAAEREQKRLDAREEARLKRTDSLVDRLARARLCDGMS